MRPTTVVPTGFARSFRPKQKLYDLRQSVDVQQLLVDTMTKDIQDEEDRKFLTAAIDLTGIRADEELYARWKKSHPSEDSGFEYFREHTLPVLRKLRTL